MTNFTHSAGFHALISLAATLLAYAVDWTVQSLNGGSLHLAPQFMVLTPLIVGLLTILGVSIRNFIERNKGG